MEIERTKQWIKELNNNQNNAYAIPPKASNSNANPYGVCIQQTISDLKSKELVPLRSHHKNDTEKVKSLMDLKPLNSKKWHSPSPAKELTIMELDGIAVYVFYVPDFTDQAQDEINECINIYGRERVAVGFMKDASTFSALWGSMRGRPRIVIIDTHGKNQSITTGRGDAMQQLTSTGNGRTNISGTEVMNIQDLPVPVADFSRTQLQLNSCHSNDTEPNAHLEGDHRQGALAGTQNTVAQAFLRTFGFANVRATIGAVNYGYFSLEPYPQNKIWQFLSLRNGLIEVIEMPD